MVRNIVSIGNKIEMFELSGKSYDDEKRVYVSQLLEFGEDEDILKIAMPIYEGKLIPLQAGRRFNLCFYTSQGLYTVDSVIENRYRIGNIYMMDVRLSSELKKFQRRQYYRLNCNFDLGYKVLTEEDFKYYTEKHMMPLELLESVYNDGISLDISGGGVRFISKAPISVDSMLFMEIGFNTADGLKLYHFIGKVISSASARNDSQVYEIRVNFVNISERDREFIIKFIFSEERKKRQKESGLE